MKDFKRIDPDVEVKPEQLGMDPEKVQVMRAWVVAYTNGEKLKLDKFHVQLFEKETGEMQLTELSFILCCSKYFVDLREEIAEFILEKYDHAE